MLLLKVAQDGNPTATICVVNKAGVSSVNSLITSDLLLADGSVLVSIQFDMCLVERWAYHRGLFLLCGGFLGLGDPVGVGLSELGAVPIVDH